MTFSIAARCQASGQLGVAVSSSSIAVGARCPWLLPGTGAASSQNVTLPSLGQQALAQLAQGASAEQALRRALADDDFSAWRQLIVINAAGETAAFSGEKTLGTHRTSQRENCVAAGNMLASPGAIDAMTEAFTCATGALADRLLAAMQAAMDAGGEAGPVHSAALKIVGNHAWPIVDLRIDWTDACPIQALQTLWCDYAPQMQDYLTRADDPRRAPSYGVPGDE
ncbi:DUF1028 domain-containing protein [Apirhabdus apintestini]|nr:DUF1028 domain-containing protein [Enterobacteriaceae bacterium CA-0114]